MKVVVCFDIEGFDNMMSLSDIVTDQEITPSMNERVTHTVMQNTISDMILLGAQVARYKVKNVKLCRFTVQDASFPLPEPD